MPCPVLLASGTDAAWYGATRVDVAAYACLVVGILLVVIRRRATSQAKTMIRADILEYRRVWDSIDPQVPHSVICPGTPRRYRCSIWHVPRAVRIPRLM
eukprot:3936149-Rhodomonas_salina.1